MKVPAYSHARHATTGVVEPEESLQACWCRGGAFNQHFRTPTFGLLRCQSCGCYRIDPPPINGEHEAAEFYTRYYDRPGIGRRPDPGSRTSRFWQVVRLERSLEPAGERVVDIGCGEGHLCGELRSAGWRQVVGVDVSRARIARARRLYPDGLFHDEPLEQTGTPAESFDLLIMDNVIEHVTEPVAMLRTLRRYLRRGGRVVLITPNMESGHFRLLGRRWTPELAPHAHIYLFTPSSMVRLLSLAGFSVDRVGSFHLPVYPPRQWAARMLSADIKGTVWRAGQELGGLYGRLIGAGPMVFGIGTVTGRDGH